MQFSKNFPYQKFFFTKKKILPPRLAYFFILEEAALILLIVLQLYRIVNPNFVNDSLTVLQYPIPAQNVLWFLGSIAFFLIGYLTIVLRDETVNHLHRNFSHALFGAAKEKMLTTNRRVFMLVFGELVFATVVGISIFVYLDPDYNLVPAPWNYVGFIIFVGLSLLLFSHTKEFRTTFYGVTPSHQKYHQGTTPVKRTTNTKTGSIRVGMKNK